MRRVSYPQPGELAHRRAERTAEDRSLFAVPKIWDGEPAFIIGGGPSFDPTKAPLLRGRIFALNWAFRARPDADVMFWSDQRFFRWAMPFMGEHTGQYKIARRSCDGKHHFDIKLIGRLSPEGDSKVRGLSTDPRRVGGMCTGGSAINLAYLFGCNPIVLLGFDMSVIRGRSNWHNFHTLQGKAGHYPPFMKHIVAMAPALRASGVDVINCAAGSALTCFPKRPLEAFL